MFSISNFKKLMKYKNTGILIWITGLSGSGKTTLAKKLKPIFSNLYGQTIVLDGDVLRKSLSLKGYSKTERIANAKKYVKLINIITKQNINVIISVIGLFHKIQILNKKVFKNYFEILIKKNIKKLIYINSKKIYSKKNVWGVDIKPEFPKKPDLIIKKQISTNKTIDKIIKLLEIKFG